MGSAHRGLSRRYLPRPGREGVRVQGRFIVSLDCEGKWGMADALAPYHHRDLTDRALAEVYDRLVAMLARHDVPATFAYVMAFTLTREERRDFALQLLPEEGKQDDWLEHYWADLRAGREEGWFQPHALDVVKADGRHEIACHSFCHRPMDDLSLSDEGARAELAVAARVAALKQVRLSTFIFPRNGVGNLAALRDAGYLGYRLKLARPAGLLGRFVRLTEEWNMRAAVQVGEPAAPDALVRIPPGYFFNWRFGGRRYVPAAVTIHRWKNLLDRTAAQGGVAHLWLHPHNLITGPGTAETLEQVLAYAASLRDAGRILIQTQQEYCETLLAAASGGGDGAAGDCLSTEKILEPRPGNPMNQGAHA
jgi:peptidoglycan/xylan/chitin deacetylase (PgdA/CDA1 family)